MTTTRKIKWTLSSGKAASVTVSLETSREINADGHTVTVPCCELHTTGEAEGMGVLGYHVQRIDHPEMAGRCGKLGIPAEQMDEIEVAIVECKATPEWRAKEANEAQARKEADDYEVRYNRIIRAMEE